MRITKRHLRGLIKEEIENLSEAWSKGWSAEGPEAKDAIDVFLDQLSDD